MLIFIILGCGFLVRIYQINNLTGGILSGDEIFDSQVKVYQFITQQAIWGGDSSYFHYLLSHIYYSIVGFSMNASRVISIIIGLLTILFSHKLFKKFSSKNTVIFTSFFIAFSVYCVYFSKISIVTEYTPFCFVLFLNFYIQSYYSKPLLNSALAGLAFVIGLFTYPAFLSIIPALLLTIIYLFIFRYQKIKSNIRFLVLNHSLLLGIVSVFYLAATYYRNYYLHTHSLMFRNGGSVTLKFDSIKEAFYALFKDLFIHAGSWYISFNDNTFFERLLVPFFTIGCFILLMRFVKYHKNKDEILETSIPVFCFSIFLFSAILVLISGPYPGARRFVGILPFFYWISALAITTIVRKNLIQYLVVILVSVYMLYKGPYIQNPNTSLSCKSNLNTSLFCKSNFNSNDDIIYELIARMSKYSALVFDFKQIKSQFEAEQYLAYHYLSKKYNARQAGLNPIYFVNEEGHVIKQSIDAPNISNLENITYINTKIIPDRILINLFKNRKYELEKLNMGYDNNESNFLIAKTVK
jgi:hypothetical protein